MTALFLLCNIHCRSALTCLHTVVLTGLRLEELLTPALFSIIPSERKYPWGKAKLSSAGLKSDAAVATLTMQD